MKIYATEFRRYNEIEVSDNLKVDTRKIVYPDGVERVEMIVIVNGVRKNCPIEVSLKNLHGELKNLLEYGVNVDSTSLQKLAGSIKEKYDSLPIKKEEDRLGFTEDGRFLSSVTIDKKGRFFENDGRDGLCGYSGIVNLNFLKVMLSNQKRALLILHGLMAPLVSLSGGYNPILLVYGDSSVGKTTITRYIQSLSADPGFNRVNMDLNGTANKIEKQLLNNYGVSVLLDDASLSNKMDFKDLFYRLSNGNEKQRMEKVDSKTRGKFHTSIFLSAEEDVVNRVPADYKGVDARVFALDVGRNDLFHSNQMAGKTEQETRTNYGMVLPFLVRYMMKEGLDNIKKWTETRKLYYSEHLRGEETVIQRWGGYFAMLDITAKMIKDVFQIEVDTEQIIQFMCDTLRKSVKIRSMETTQSLIKEELFPELAGLAIDKKVRGETRKVLYVKSTEFKKEINKFIGRNRLDSNYCAIVSHMVNLGLLLPNPNDGASSIHIARYGRCYILAAEHLVESEGMAVEKSTAA